MSSTNVDAFVQFAEDGLFEKVKQCLDKGNVPIDSIGKYGWTALMCAAMEGREGVCNLLITRGCKADMQSKSGNTALMWAAEYGHEGICNLLITRGCNLDMQDKYGSTALMNAAARGREGVCDLLITRGCKLDMQDKNGGTALMRAADRGLCYKGVCDLLITRGCKADMQDEYGSTALMKAAANGHIPIMISLIEAGCNHSLKNKEGKSGMDLLRQNYPDKVKEMEVTHSLTAVVTHSFIHSRTEMNLNFK
jgi:ankyrin repeat protein